MEPEMMKLAAVSALVVLLAGCATSPIPLALPCSVGPVILDKGASTRLTRNEKEQIVALNQSGAKLCRWAPPR